MSRKVRTTKKIFKVFCEGDTEHNYIDEMKRQRKLSIAIKPVNMKGGGYINFLDQLKTDSNSNSLAKFIIVDGDLVLKDEGEKKNFKELFNYCMLKNKSGRIPHFLIVNFPDFEYLACLHTPQYKNQNTPQYIIKNMGYQSLDEFKADKKVYSVLNTNENSYEIMLAALPKKRCLIENVYKINKTQYEIAINSKCDWEKLGLRGSNIHELFEILNEFEK